MSVGTSDYSYNRGLLSSNKRLVPTTVGLAALALYALTRDRIGNYDGVLSASIAELWRPEQGLALLLPHNHFLFDALGWLAYRCASLASLGGYETLQLLSAAASAAALVVVAEGGARSAKGVAAAAALAVSASFWMNAAGATNYASGTAAAALALGLLRRQLEHPSPARANAALAAAFGSVWLHAGNLPLAPVVVWSLARRRSEPLGRLLLRAALWAAAVAAPVVLVHRLWQPDALTYFWRFGTGATTWFAASQHAAEGAPFGGPTGPVRALATFAAAGASGWGALGLAAAFGLAALLPAEKAAGGVVEARWREALAAAFGAFVLLQSLWQPGNLYYAATPWLIAALASASTAGLAKASARSRRLLFALSLAGAGTAAGVNFAASIGPSMDERSAPLVGFARAVGRGTDDGSVVLVSGLRHEALKVYLPYYARRNRVALDLLARSFPPGTAERRFLEATADGVFNRAGLYATSDLWDPSVRAELKARWGLTPERIELTLDLFDKATVLESTVPTVPSLVRLTPNARFHRVFRRD